MDVDYEFSSDDTGMLDHPGAFLPFLTMVCVNSPSFSTSSPLFSLSSSPPPRSSGQHYCHRPHEEEHVPCFENALRRRHGLLSSSSTGNTASLVPIASHTCT